MFDRILDLPVGQRRFSYGGPRAYAQEAESEPYFYNPAEKRDSSRYILLEIEAESSALTDSSVTTTAASSTIPSVPDVLSRTTNSTVLIRAGSTFVLGGILQDSLDRRETGIPYLRNTPAVGWLFKGKDDSRTKDELLIFPTPTIVAGVSTTTLLSANQLWENRPGGGVRP